MCMSGPLTRLPEIGRLTSLFVLYIAYRIGPDYHTYPCKCTVKQFHKLQGPVVQSVVSLTSSLRVISLTVLADSIYNILIFFAEKM